MGEAKVILGDALEALAGMQAGSADCVVTDPPAGIGFMSKAFDSFRGRAAFLAFLTPALAGCLRVCRPGAVALVWALPRTSHWTGTALEDAGWQVEDRIAHLFGCLSDDTEILTDKGWEPYHKVETGSLALGYNVGDDTFRWEPVKEVLTYDYCETAYRITSGRTDQIVSRNHRCLVHDGNGYRFVLAEEAAREREVYVPVVENVPGLLSALPLPQRHAGTAEQGLFADVCGESHRAQELGETEAGPGLPPVWHGVPAERSGGQGAGEAALLRLQLCGSGEGRAAGLSGSPEGDRFPGQGRLDGAIPDFLPGEDDGAEQPGLEGRGDGLQDSRAVRRGEVRPLPGRPSADGPQGRLRDGTPRPRGPGDRPPVNAGGGGSPRGPRPDEQRAEQPHALRLQPRPQAVRGARHAAADLARVTPVFYRGVVWCVRVPSGAFVARRNGKVFVTGNSGFPKHKSKLKPACEDWWVCRKPGPKWLGVEECRVPSGADYHDLKVTQGGADCGVPLAPRGAVPRPFVPGAGRWPANVALSHHEACNGVCHPECPVRLLDEQAGERKSGGFPASHGAGSARTDFNVRARGGTESGRAGELGGTGGASRFFYCAKASRKDRGEGNDHPCVKSQALMRWLVKLACPAGGLVLDPFAGSGSTGLGCLATGRRFVGVEADPHYHEIATRRLAAARARGVHA